MKNISNYAEILSIYLAYISKRGNENDITSLKKNRENLYCGIIKEQVFNNYKSIIKNEIVNNLNYHKNCENKISNNSLKKMCVNSKRYLLNKNAISQRIPTAIIIGGPQGSGKTNLVLMSNLMLTKTNEKAIILDLDSYRGFYENAFKIFINYPNDYEKITNKAVGKIMENITSDVLNYNYNFIFEGTFGGSIYTLNETLKYNKYNVVVRLMCVCREDSLLSIFERYINSKESIGLGRLTKIEEHDKRYYGILDNLKKIAKIDVNVEIYKKNNVSYLPELLYETKGRNINLYDIMLKLRKNSYNETKLTFKKRLGYINEYLYKNETNADVLCELEKLNNIINPIINDEL